MALYDELEGLLPDTATPEQREKLAKASHLLDYYDGLTDDPTPPARLPARSAPPAATPPAAAPLAAGLDDILAKLDERLDLKLSEFEKTKGGQLFNNSVSTAVRVSRELGRVDQKHRADFNEDLDEEKLNSFINEQKTKGRSYATVGDAYEDFTRDRRIDKTVDQRVAEKLKQRQSGLDLPGTTPVSARSPIAVMRAQTKKEGAGETAVSKAGSALDERLAAQRAAAS
jgi:hypothetical protein